MTREFVLTVSTMEREQIRGTATFLLYLYVIFSLMYFASEIGEKRNGKIILESNGQIYFLKKGLLRNQKFPLRILNGEWHYQATDGEWLEVPSEEDLYE